LGIGLKVTKELVGLHRGSIAIRSEGPGKGSEFIVEIPLERGGATASPDEKPAAERTPVRRRVVLIEDEKNLADVLTKALRLMGNDVRECNDGTSAIAAVKEFRPSSVLVDIGLPDIDGYEVARRLRKIEEGSAERMKLIALTGFGRDEDRERAMQAGFDQHITKPVSMNTLKNVLS
jgi:CheY-like chemotaxis protein